MPEKTENTASPEIIDEKRIPLDGAEGYIKAIRHESGRRLELRFRNADRQPVRTVEQVSLVLKTTQGPQSVSIVRGKQNNWFADLSDIETEAPEGVLRCRIEGRPCRAVIEANRLIVPDRPAPGRM
jgi:hypothetical protein